MVSTSLDHSEQVYIQYTDMLLDINQEINLLLSFNAKRPVKYVTLVIDKKECLRST